MREENNLTHAKREIKETKDKLKTTKRKRNHFFSETGKIMNEEEEEEKEERTILRYEIG